MTIRISTLVIIAGLGLSVAACGQRPGERALTGGLIGAGAGAAVGAATGGNPGTGALIGGGAGAIGGAVTAPRGAR
jgi:osmotically inducible lipoprotein OsmB